ESVQAGDIQKTIEDIGQPLIKQVEAFDVYTGEGLESNEKSIAFNLHYRDSEKTLTDKEVDASFDEVIEAVKSTLHAKIRYKLRNKLKLFTFIQKKSQKEIRNQSNIIYITEIQKKL